MMKRSVIFLHRWLGVSICLFFLLWFPSGIGMMYWDFPSVTAADRLDRSAALEPSTIRLSPAEAYAVLNQTQAPAQQRAPQVGHGDPVTGAEFRPRRTCAGRGCGRGERPR